MKPKHSSRSLFLVFKMPILLVLWALLGAVASAQSGHGTISGRAVDKAGAVLDGARVRLQPGDIVTATDGQGEFNFIGLTPGNYTLTISYVGFTDFTKQVTVAAGQANHIEARIDISGKPEEVTVIADRPHGEAEAINRQRTSDNILQVLPSDVITALPNANIADAVGRLPSVTLERDEGEGKYVQIRGTEPRLNAVTIDGVLVPAPEDNVRQVKLDTIPADIVESVEVNKTLSANQDAEAIGGSVNLVTKTAGDQPTLNLGVIGGFTPILNTRAIAQVSGTVGQRFGATKKFGALFSGSFDYNGRGIDDIEPSLNDTAVPSYNSMDVREYRYRRKRYGFGGGLDYKLGDGAGLYLHYFYSDFRDFGDKWVYTLNDGTGCDGTPTNGCPPEKFSGSERAPDYRIGNLAIGGKHIFTNSWLAWNVSASASLQTAAAGNPGFDFTYNPNAPTTMNGQVPGTPLCANITPAPNPYLPQWTPGCDAAGGPYYTPGNWNLLDVNTTSGNTSQVNLQGAVSYATNYHLGKHNATFEFGFKERNAHKGQNAYSPTYDNPTAAAPLMTQYLSGFTNPNYYFNDYRLGPVVQWPQILGSLPNLVSRGILTLDSGATHLASDASNFEYTERVSAAYAMNTVDSGRFRLQLGFRVEATQLDTLGYIVKNDSNGNWISTTPAPANNWYWNPLPSAQLRYRLTGDSDLRVSYGRGISRPNPYDTIPYVELDQSTNPYSYTFGNPNLVPEHANNYDVLYEHYLKPFGEIQGGFFYKQLSAPIYYTQNLPSSSGPYPGYITSTVINGTHAWLAGFEAAYIQHLGFLPGGLSGLGISANYSWTTSNSGPLPGRPDTPALQRQAPSTWNISPTYDKGRFSTRVGLSYNGASIYQYQWQQCTLAIQATPAGCSDPANLGPKGPAGDNYFYPHLQVDAQASYRIKKNLTFLVQGLNLSNEVFGFYNGSPDYVNQREFYSPTYSFGLRWEPRREY
ncbi:MAG: TonB-dependent receptor [Terriglobales bacterium]|jgi:TonB-dependent receptor